MDKYSKYIMIGLFILIVYASILIIKPLITALLGSLVLAYIFYPVFTRTQKIIRSKILSAILVSLVIVLLITIPSILLLNSMTKEVFVLYTIAEQRIISGNILGIDCEKNQKICSKFDFFTTNLRLRFYLEQNLGKIRTYLTEKISDIIFSIPHRALEIFITLLTTFFLFKDGEEIVKRSRTILSLKEHHEKPLLKKLNDIIYAILYGNVVISIVEGVLGGLAFWVAGIPSPIFWGIVMIIVSLLPAIGASVIWVPAVVIMFLNGYVWHAAILGAFCLIVIGGIGMILKPKIIGDRAKVHPLFVLFGVLGGVVVFNVVGLVVGPVILALFVTFLEIYESEKIKDIVKDTQ